MKEAIFIVTTYFSFLSSALAITITEGTYNGIDHYIIYTKHVTYYYDKDGGAFSRIVDRNGNDWISFSKHPWNKTPESASSSFRGVPNLVKGNTNDAAIGYPGYMNCTSKKINKKTIESSSKDGLWNWKWTFTNKYAELIMVRIDSTVNYKVMYNGVIAGRFNPENQYHGSNLGGPYFKVYDFNKGEKLYGNWLWMYLGDRDVKKVFFMAMKKPDHQLDSFSFMGNTKNGSGSDNGMVTFGFGVKDDFTALLSSPDNHFIIGIIDKRVEKPNDHIRIKRIIESFLK